MKESIGGTWLLGFVLVFIVIFSAYLAVSINYTKAFKVKNRIINIIEENEGYTQYRYTQGGHGYNFETMPDDQLMNINKTDAKIYYYLKDIGYSRDNVTEENADKCFDGDENSYRVGGYCVQKICSGQGAYYRVMTFIKFQLPLINFKLMIPISGETKTIFHTQDNNEFQCTTLNG